MERCNEIENGWLHHHAPEPHRSGKCDVCGESLYTGEDIFCMPTGETIHYDCLEDWAEEYRREAEEELPD